MQWGAGQGTSCRQAPWRFVDNPGQQGYTIGAEGVIQTLRGEADRAFAAIGVALDIQLVLY